MISGAQNIFKIPELKRRILWSFALLAAYRIGVHIPTPGINGDALASFFAQAKGTLFSLIDMFSGGALERLSVFALGIMPYISASIILQLLTVVIPYLDRLQKEGEIGRKKIVQYTRYGTVVLSMIQGFGIAVGLENMRGAAGEMIVLVPDGHYPHGRHSLHHVAGRADHGEGNWKRNLPDHFCGHRGPNAECRCRYL
jgi:preprotein translocase subunit SecY